MGESHTCWAPALLLGIFRYPSSQSLTKNSARPSSLAEVWNAGRKHFKSSGHSTQFYSPSSFRSLRLCRVLGFCLSTTARCIFARQHPKGRVLLSALPSPCWGILSLGGCWVNGRGHSLEPKNTLRTFRA